MEIKNIYIYRGDDCELSFTFEQDGDPYDLQGARIDLHIKGGNDTIKLSSTDDTINIISNNEIIVTISHAATQSAKWTTADYDLQITKDGEIKTVLRGKVYLTHDVTIVE